MNRNKCVIVVPIYKTEFNWDEYNSIKQLFKILPNYKYDIVAICPNGLDVSYYGLEYKFKDYFFFDESYFNVYPKGYNSLLLTYDFYNQFNTYEFMLIYQPDCWIFRDELEYWCNQNYDYIGAPQLFRYPEYLITSSIGNGGLSLRKISTYLKLCDKYNYLCSDLCLKNYLYLGEDRIFSYIEDHGIKANFNIPSFYEASKFSWETNPDIFYQITDKKLPFGCHAYKKIIHKDFWDDFIFYDKKRYSVVTFLFGDYDTLKDPLIVDDAAEYICITDRTDLTSNVWKFENIVEYDISKYNDWQKTMIARYTALNHISTNYCIIIDASIEIKKELGKFINMNLNSDVGFIVHPFRDSYLNEFDEWINKRSLDKIQKDEFIDYCNKHNFDYINGKSFIMSTVMFMKKNDRVLKFVNHVLKELMNNYDFSIRIDQLYLSVIFFKYYYNLTREYFSYQILNSDYFAYYYHNSTITHIDDYKPDLTTEEIKEVYYQNIICKYLI
jgi:hypothetical protein